MSVDYKYSISANVTVQTVNVHNLHTDIETNLTLANATFTGINIKSDDLYISFTQSIETSEKSDMDTIVQDHNNTLTVTALKTVNIPFYPKVEIVMNKSYISIGRFIYPGYLNSSKFTGIDILAYMDNGITSYDVEIVNREDNSIILEQNFTNTTMDLLTFTTINENNIPENTAVIEISVKLNMSGKASKKVYIDNIAFWLD